MPRGKSKRGEIQTRAQLLGAAIRNARVLRGMTQQDLADRMGTHVARVSEAERGQYKLRLETLEAFATALDVPINELLTREPPKT